MSTDLRWMQLGDLLVDASGDIAITSPATNEAMFDMVRTRVKAEGEGWQLYPSLGAKLDAVVGQLATQELLSQIERRLQKAITDRFLPSNAIQVKAVPIDGTGQIDVMVYINNQNVLTVSLDRTTGQVISA